MKVVLTVVRVPDWADSKALESTRMHPRLTCKSRACKKRCKICRSSDDTHQECSERLGAHRSNHRRKVDPSPEKNCEVGWNMRCVDTS